MSLAIRWALRECCKHYPQQVAAFRDETSRSLGVQVPDAQAAKLFPWMLGVYRSALEVTSVTPTYRIGLGAISPDDVRTRGLPVQLVAHGETTPGRDGGSQRRDGVRCQRR